MKVDVCLVTKNENKVYYLLKKLNSLAFVNDIIIETSKPLGYARMQAIRKVKTEYFLFIDDDVFIPDFDKWFKDLVDNLSSDIGAVQGRELVKGLGKKWDEAINAFISSTSSKVVEVSRHKWGRGYTNNTLLKTELVKDWKPSNKKLEAFEDIELTKHIQSNGYKWLVVPTFFYHIKSWWGLKENALWHGTCLRQSTFFNFKDKYSRIFQTIIWAIKNLFDPRLILKRNWKVRYFTFYQNFFLLIGFFLG